MSREHRLGSLQHANAFDLLVIGCGATGCGIAVDAASRGLAVALIDKNDLAEGTSSRSTKLIHGGVRYLEMDVKHLDRALQTYLLGPARACYTRRFALVGAEKFDAHGEAALIKAYGLAADVAQRLHHAYGDQAGRVADLAKNGLGARLHPDHPYLEAEVVYAVQSEFAERASDVLTRRLSLALLDNAAALAALPRVIELMAAELGWSPQRCDDETAICIQRLTVAI